MATWSWRQGGSYAGNFRGYHLSGNEDVLDAGRLGLVRVGVRVKVGLGLGLGARARVGLRLGLGLRVTCSARAGVRASGGSRAVAGPKLSPYSYP